MNKILCLIIVLSVSFRFIGLNWDQNFHLHPDERFLTMVGGALKWPINILGYLNTQNSTVNPHNIGYPFYVYGTLPLLFVKLLSGLLNHDTYNGLTLVGRTISAVFDSSVIFLVYLIAQKIFKQKSISLFSAVFYGLSVLPIQLSHYFAVDTFLVFFLYLTFYLLTFDGILISLLLGITYGLATASKISAVLFLPVILLSYLIKLINHKNLKITFKSVLLFLVSAIICLRLAQPYLFNNYFDLNPKLIKNWQELKSYEDPSGWFPPVVQWLNTPPILFPFANIFFFGLGPVLFLFSLSSFKNSFRNLKKHPEILLHLCWIFGLFIYQGVQLAKPLRYFYPVFPSLAILAGPVLYRFFTQKNRIIMIIVFFLSLSWPLAFVSIYLSQHPRIIASNWIYRHIPAGRVISCEYWDDCLPLGGAGPYRVVELPLYNLPDNQAKMEEIQTKLNQLDYLILSSNRLFGSISSVPEKYPHSSKFYQDLFSEKLGFIKIAEFTSRPHLSVPFISLCLTPPFLNYGEVLKDNSPCPSGITITDDYADETFTVYDHPKVIIFQKR
jgi:hypothetical protein